jgi:hypothetical protein
MPTTARRWETKRKLNSHKESKKKVGGGSQVKAKGRKVK